MVIHLKGPVKGSKQHSRLPLTLQAPLDLPDYRAQVVEQFAQQHGNVAEPFLVLDSPQNWKFCATCKWVIVAHTNREYVTFHPLEEAHLALCLLFGCRKG